MPLELSDAFRRVLRSYRKQKDWSQMKLAMEAGMHLNALGSLERGLYSPSLQTVFQLCRALAIPVSEFLDELEKLMTLDEKASPPARRSRKSPAPSSW